MDLHQWLDAEEGRAKWLAESLGVSKSAVSNWRLQGVPMLHMERIEALTAGAVRPDSMLRHALECKKALEGQRRSATDRATQEQQAA
jgi:DNA-binding transcriptional regulator YdaS (Cro superfamily)